MEIGQRITIPVQGLGHVPAFKNSKQLFVQNGKPRMITKPAYKQWMDRTIRVIESHLNSLFRTGEGVTQTGQSLQSWIVSSMPLDDSVDWIPESGGWNVRRVPKGEEGIVVTIERIS